MRGFLYVLTAAGVIGLAFWAYRETFRTQEATAELRQVRAEIAALSEAISVQRAEWAWLNRPDRLRELARLNVEALGLMPMLPQQFGAIAEVPFPPEPEPDFWPLLGAPVETMAGTDEEEPL
jgi:hypothetical protein